MRKRTKGQRITSITTKQPKKRRGCWPFSSQKALTGKFKSHGVKVWKKSLSSKQALTDSSGAPYNNPNGSSEMNTTLSGTQHNNFTNNSTSLPTQHVYLDNSYVTASPLSEIDHRKSHSPSGNKNHNNPNLLPAFDNNTIKDSITYGSRQTMKSSSSPGRPLIFNKEGGIRGYLYNNAHFRALVKWAFDEVDTNKSGCIDREELYTCMLLLHLRLAAYLGPAATRTASRARINHIFTTLDRDNNGTLDEEEFLYVMAVVCSQMVSRVIISLLLSLFLIPFLSIHVMAFGKQYVVPFAHHCIENMHRVACAQMDFSSFLVMLPNKYALHLQRHILPDTYLSCVKLIMVLLCLSSKSVTFTSFAVISQLTFTYQNQMMGYTPDKLWDTLPSIIVHSTLVTLIVPRAMFLIDVGFRILLGFIIGGQISSRKVKVTV